MSINSCQINASSIDAICASRRAVIVDWLLSSIEQPETKSHPTIRHYPARDEYVEPTEQKYIEVSVEINGQTYSQTHERLSDTLAMIMVSDTKQNVGSDPVVRVHSIDAVRSDVTIDVEFRINSIKKRLN